MVVYKIMDCSRLARATTDFTRRAAIAVGSEAPAMLPPCQPALLLLPGHQDGRLFVFFFLLRVALGQLEISHGGLTVPNMLAKPASLYHRWEVT